MFLVGFVLLLIVFAIWASTLNRDLVEQSYYEAGLEYQDRIDQLERAGSNAVRFKFERGTRQLSMTFADDSLHVLPEKGELVLYRPSNAAWDQRYDLRLDATGAQVFDLSTLPNGAWTAKVSWTIDDQGYYYEEALFFQ